MKKLPFYLFAIPCTIIFLVICMPVKILFDANRKFMEPTPPKDYLEYKIKRHEQGRNGFN